MQVLIEGAAVFVVTNIEVLGWCGHNAASRASAEKLLGCMDEILLSTLVVKQTISLRTVYSIKLPDAVVAAAALTHGLKLATRNLSDFERIDELNIVSPFTSVP